MTASRIERLLGLLNVLIDADRLLTADRIRAVVPGYPDADDSFHRQFERDKAALREMGLDVVTAEIPGSYPPASGYRIPGEQAHLADPGLEPDELAALHLASSAIRLDGIEGSGGLWKLGGGPATGEAPSVVDLPAGERLVTLFAAVSRRQRTTFRYQGEERTVLPRRLDCTRGRWYLGAFDEGRQGDRHFRLDRIEGAIEVGSPGGFDPPEGGVAGVRMEAWQFGSGPARTARLLVDADHVDVLRAAAPSVSIAEQRPDGSIVAELLVTDPAAFRSLVLDFLEHAEVLGPPELRDDLVRWVRSAAERGAVVKISTAERLQRLISIVSWVNEHDGPTIEEVCARFAIGQDELVSQLEMASMVGAESDEYGDMPVELYFEDDRVFVSLTAFKRPLRLTPEQGLALVASGAALLQAQGSDPDGPLARALAKVAALVGIEPNEMIEVDLGEGDAAVLDALRSAIATHRPVELDYWSSGRDSRTHRTVEPWRVFNEAGAWYLQAHCRLAGGPRVFRVDRIRGATVADGTFDPPRTLPDPVAYQAGATDPRIVLDLAPEAAWVATLYPVDRVDDRPDGRIRVTMPAGAPAFLARLLLRLGPDASVVEADDRSDGPALAAAAARRILERYDAG